MHVEAISLSPALNNMRKFFLIAALLIASLGARGQQFPGGNNTQFSNEKGKAGQSTTGGATFNGAIYVVFPPGTASADYASFRAAGSAWDSPLIDGVTVQLNATNIAQINTGSVGAKQLYVPSTSSAGLGNCNGYVADSDTCIKLTGVSTLNGFVTFASPIFYPFAWGSLEQTTSPGIDQWFQATPAGVRKKVNLLDFTQSQGALNPTTPGYVNISSYTALFNPARQDVFNAVETASTCAGGNYTGHTGVAATRAAASSIATVTLANHGYTTGETIFVTATVGSTDYNVQTATGKVVTVTGVNTFTYDTGVVSAGGDSATLTLIADAESFVVPYELPYLAMRQAIIKAVFLHYNSAYSNAFGGTAAQLGYFRAGPFYGAETFPPCLTNMEAMTAPYTLVAPTATVSGTGSACFVGGGCTNWGLGDYYRGDIGFLTTIPNPALQIAASINVTGAGATASFSSAKDEASAASGQVNAASRTVIVGQQGGSLADITSYNANPTQAFSVLNPPNICGNWGCGLTTTNQNSGTPIELQQISISAYDDGNCTSQAKSTSGHCGVPSATGGGDSGDMRQWLAFFSGQPATDGTNTVTLPGHVTILELYYRDAGLALDPQWCVIAAGACTTAYTSPGGNYTWYTLGYEFTAFNAVGLGAACGPQFTTATPQASATGNCSYAQALKNFHH